jgi:hypothetical protein
MHHRGGKGRGKGKASHTTTVAMVTRGSGEGEKGGGGGHQQHTTPASSQHPLIVPQVYTHNTKKNNVQRSVGTRLLLSFRSEYFPRPVLPPPLFTSDLFPPPSLHLHLLWFAPLSFFFSSGAGTTAGGSEAPRWADSLGVGCFTIRQQQQKEQPHAASQIQINRNFETHGRRTKQSSLFLPLFPSAASKPSARYDAADAPQ